VKRSIGPILLAALVGGGAASAVVVLLEGGVRRSTPAAPRAAASVQSGSAGTRREVSSTAPTATADAPTRTHLTVTVDLAHSGPVIPSDFLGLSFDTPTVDSRAIVSMAPALSRLLSGLGNGVLRLSGDSADRTQWLPSRSAAASWAAAALTPADLRNLATLMRAAGWRLILGLDLGHPIPTAIVDEARSAVSILGSSLAGLAIGNEPDLYTRPVSQPFRSALGSEPLRPAGWGLRQYRLELAKLSGALAAAAVSTPLFGPDTTSQAWLNSYAAQVPERVETLAPHLYPLDRCLGGRLTPGPSASSLLSRDVARREAVRIEGFVHAAASHGLPLRIDETNSVACAGQPGVSDTFAATLWALDYSLIAAREGVAGLNFHGGLGACQGAGTIVSQWYSPLCAMPGGQLRARPEYYALLSLRSLEGCAFVRAAYRTSRDISVYALRARDGTLRVVIDDMETAAGTGSTTSQLPSPVQVTVQVARTYQHGSVIRLSAPSIQAKGGVTLGGKSLGSDGSLPSPLPTPIAGSSGRFAVQVTPGTAALVTLAP
jgi:hypothetical protein